jgi:hypothetical protein
MLQRRPGTVPVREVLSDEQAAVLARRYALAVRHGDPRGPLWALAATGAVAADLAGHLGTAVTAFRSALTRYPPSAQHAADAHRTHQELLALLVYARQAGERGPVHGWTPSPLSEHRVV